MPAARSTATAARNPHTLGAVGRETGGKVPPPAANGLKTRSAVLRRGAPYVAAQRARLSRDYPIPEHRECGDIDIYLYGQSDKGDRILHEIGAHLYFDVPKHSEYVWDGVLIENHRTILNVRRNRTERELNALLVRLLEKDGTHGLAPGIQTPPATFNAIFLIRHAAVHFQKEGIVLRHLATGHVS